MTTCIYETARLPRYMEPREDCVIHPLTPEKIAEFTHALDGVNGYDDRLAFVLDNIVLRHIFTLPESPVSDDGALYYAQHLLHIIDH